MSPLALALLALALAAAAYYSGWRSARAYLQAAQAVSDVTNAVAKESNEHAFAGERVVDQLAKFETALLSSTAQLKALEENASVNTAKVQEAFIDLFQGFERAGIVRSSRPTPGRQVGERPPDPD